MTTPNRNPWPVLLVTVLGFFMIMLDTTIVYVATPSILSSLHASLDQILWVFNGYLLTYAVLLITAGRLGDLFGPRQLFAAGLMVFTAASALCGFSQDANQLIAARVIQGVGAAMLAPQTLTILMAIFPPARRGAAFGITGAVIGISTVAGPTLGGLIVTNADWRWIFFLNVPVGLIALVGTFLVIPDVRTGRQHRFDWIGVLLSSAALFGIVFGLIEGQRYDWSTITGWLTIPMVIGAGVALFGAGAAIVTALASTTSAQSIFILPFVLTGVGLGLVFAPMTTVAMRDITPAMAGAASGVLNTTRQLGSVIGAAVVGAVLQNQLATAFHDQAVTAATHLPPAFRAPFVDGFAQAAKSGLQVGRGQTGASVPANLPPAVVGTVQRLVHDVFINGYVIAMRPTVGVAVAVLAIASLSCLLVINRRQVPDEAPAPANVAAVA